MSKSLSILVLARSDPWTAQLSKSFENLGHRVDFLDLKEITRTQLRDAFQRKPDFTYGTSFYTLDRVMREGVDLGAEVQNLSEEFQIPMALWMVDGPFTGSYFWREKYRTDSFPKWMKIFSVDREHIKYFQSKTSDVFHLPIGISEKYKNFKVNDDLKSRFACDLSFVGKPPHFDLKGAVETDDQLHQIFSVLFVNELNDLLKEIFVAEKQMLSETDIGNACAQLWEGLDRLFQKKIDEPYEYHRAQTEWLKSTESWLPKELWSALEIWCDRLPMIYSYYRLSDLLRHLRSHHLKIYGGRSWNHYLNRMDSGDRLSDDELMNLFASSQINLCYTKLHFFTAVHERPLWVLAAGGFALTDERAELWDLFEKDEIATYSSPEELKDKITYYLSRPDLRAKMIEAGRRKVFAKHTYKHRLASLVETMSAFL